MQIQPVVLSGGSGTRLWPLSREQYPKQLLPLCGEHTMLQATVLRLDSDAGEDPLNAAAPIVVGNEEYRFIVGEQLRAVSKRADSIILEPVGRNTAPALTLAALQASRDGGDPILVVMPADHVIRDGRVFRDAIRTAAVLASQGVLVTFGIAPTTPETGYGYLCRGLPMTGLPHSQPYVLARFVEKPDAVTAQRYVNSGDYFWNSGIFIMKASAWLDEIGRHRPDIADACRRAFQDRRQDHDFLRVGHDAFVACPAESIDYAVMEPVTGKGAAGSRAAAVITLDAGWSDVGAWDALWTVNTKDDQGNVITGDVMVHDTSNTLVIANSRLVACVGLERLVVIETADAVMVASKDRTPDVKKIVERLKREGRTETAAHRKIHRPWGYYDSIDDGDRFQVKRIVVNPGASLSMQMHHHRAEHWIVVRGTARVTRGDEAFLLSENQSTYIPIGTRHRLENPGKLPLEMIEVQSGGYLGEDDIVRFDDTYGRC